MTGYVASDMRAGAELLTFNTNKMDTKHTPGPWMIIPGSTTVGVPGYVFFKGSADEIKSVKEVATVQKVSCLSGNVVNNLTKEEVAANTQLIADAPTMLDLIQRMHQYIDDNNTDGHHTPEILKEADELIQRHTN